MSSVHFVRQYRFVLMFMVLLVFCSVMVIRAINKKQSRHVDIREAFVLLHTLGHTNPATQLYNVLLRELPELPSRTLTEDFQRTLLLVDPAREQQGNLIYNYHWAVSREMEKRSDSTLMHALKLAKETQ